MFKKAADIAGMMKSIATLQSKMQEVQKEIQASTFEGSAVNGLVKVEINGLGEVTRSSISPTLLKDADADLIADAFGAALNTAVRIKDAATKEKLAAATKGALPNIPGLDLMSMLKG